MATRVVNVFDAQIGLTATSDNFVLNPTAQTSIVAENTVTGFATVQFTIDPEAAISADTATWVDAASGSQSASFAESSLAPVTGVRLKVSSGTWNIKVLQVTDTDKDA